MRQRLIFLLKTYIFWVLLFVASKIIFLTYQTELTLELPIKHWFLSIWHGLKMDIAMTAYIALLYATIIGLTFYLKGKVLATIFKALHIIFASLFLLVIFVDLEIYRNWSFHLDMTPLQYLSTPKEALGSMSVPHFILCCVLYALALFYTIKIYNKKILINLEQCQNIKYYTMPLFLVIGGSMIIPARGGFDVQPMNTSFVYYTSDLYANHIAVNPVWNFLYALDHMDNYDKDYNALAEDKAQEMVKKMMKDDMKAPKIINISQPNIILIILESFSSDLLEYPDIAPNLHQLSKDGLFFENCYSNAGRSDKGLASILSAFPAFPGDAIIKNSAKAEKMPNIGKSLKKLNYHNEFFYGGDINFANLKSYLNISRFDKITTKLDFPSKYYGAKWGVHDEYIFSHVTEVLKEQKEPSFNTVYTLSSHEPFDVPEHVIEGESIKNKFLNTALYTDKHLGKFINNLKASPKWDNTLVIITADHGSTFINKYKQSEPKKYHIPLIWTGGALSQTGIIDTYCSQTDIIATLLDQLDEPYDEFLFSKNILAPDVNGFAYFSYKHEGCGYIDKESTHIYDENANSFLLSEGDKSTENNGRAYLQVSYNYFINK